MARYKSTTSFKMIYLRMLLTFTILASLTPSTLSNGNNSTTSSLSSSSSPPPPAYSPDTPWPGSQWLSRIAQSSSATPHQSSPSTYSALLSDAPHSHPVKNFNCFINSFVFSDRTASHIVATFRLYWGYYVLSYLRNFLAAMVVYYLTAGIFHYHCYIHPRNKVIFADRIRPSREIIRNQIALAQSSLFCYSALPVFSDWLIESGYTKVYYNVSDIGGLFLYGLYLVLYFALVEIGIYWMHRTLHENKFLYKHVHLLHHQYNKPESLTPWASIAFHPLDGILQASPYVFWLLFVPCHYLTHVALVFFTAIWATYIHDAMDWNVDPIMGSKYHTAHHTHYVYNYGQVFTFCDSFWGTLRVPMKKTGVVGERQVLVGGEGKKGR